MILYIRKHSKPFKITSGNYREFYNVLIKNNIIWSLFYSFIDTIISYYLKRILHNRFFLYAKPNFFYLGTCTVQKCPATSTRILQPLDFHFVSGSVTPKPKLQSWFWAFIVTYQSPKMEIWKKFEKMLIVYYRTPYKRHAWF